MSLEAELQRRWYGKPGWLWILLPLAFLYRIVVALRRRAYRRRLLNSWRAPVPVLVVGNIAVGGTGKTPVVIALCAELRKLGYTPGIVSRGYGAKPPSTPYPVTPESAVAASGDEPLLLARRTGCPVVIAPDRCAAARFLLSPELLQHFPRLERPCDFLISDDGLQHYALERDIEWVVLDGSRGIGNGHCLPVGPLREPAWRLNHATALLVNRTALPAAAEVIVEPVAPRFEFTLRPGAMVHLASGREVDSAQWCKNHPRVHAVAGIGNPTRFFATLFDLGCAPVGHAFPDHHVFSAGDLRFAEPLPVVMTEKDAVKCAALVAGDVSADVWFLRVDAALPDSLVASIPGTLRAR
jgi:tetraacyldisaccharide 4'-kinase